MRKLPWKVSFHNNVAELADEDNVMDPSMEGIRTVRVGKDVWVPFVGRKIAGKHHVTTKELTKPAFGMDLGGVPVANLKKGSILP